MCCTFTGIFVRVLVNAPTGPLELVLMTLQNSEAGCSSSLPFQYSRYLEGDRVHISKPLDIIHHQLIN